MNVKQWALDNVGRDPNNIIVFDKDVVRRAYTDPNNIGFGKLFFQSTFINLCRREPDTFKYRRSDKNRTFCEFNNDDDDEEDDADNLADEEDDADRSLRNEDANRLLDENTTEAATSLQLLLSETEEEDDADNLADTLTV